MIRVKNILLKKITLGMISFFIMPLLGMDPLRNELVHLHSTLNRLGNVLEKNISGQLQSPYDSNTPSLISYRFLPGSWALDEYDVNQAIIDLEKHLGSKFKYASDTANNVNALSIYAKKNLTEEARDMLESVLKPNNHLIVYLHPQDTETMTINEANRISPKGISIFSFAYGPNGILETLEFPAEIEALKQSFQKVATQPIQPQIPPQKPSEIKKPTEPQQPIQPYKQPLQKLPGELLYTRVNESWYPIDFNTTFIHDLQNRLGVTLKRVENPGDSLLRQHKNTLYFYVIGGRPGSPEEAALLDKITREISSKNGHFLLCFNWGDQLQGFRTLKNRIQNDVSVFYFRYNAQGIVATDNYQEEINELRAALRK